MASGPRQPREGERRARTLKLALAAGLAGVLAIVVLIVVSQSGDSSGDTEIESAAGSETTDLQQSGDVIGAPTAAVTVTEFGDLQCPVCREFSRTVVPELLAGPVADGKAKMRFANWAILGPDSVTAAKAALAAAPQDKVWDFVELFYENQGPENTGYVTDEFVTAIGEEAGLDVAAWNRAREAPELDAQLDAIDREAVALGFGGTPSIAVAGPGGSVELPGVPTAAEVEAAIDEASE